MARPMSDAAVGLMAAMVDGPGTCRQLSQRTGMAVHVVRMALDNMVRRGDAGKLEPVRVSGVKRPVPVYGRAVARQHPGDDCRGCGGVVDLIAAWAGLLPADQSSAGGAHARS